MQQYYIGIDLGGTRIKIGLVSEGKILAKKKIAAASAHGLAVNLAAVKEAINDLLTTQHISSKDLKGIGLGFPGLVDAKQGKILSTNQKYDDAPALDLRAWVNEQWGVPLWIDNDARMAAVGEWKYGAAKDTDDVVVMTIGTGIGTAAIIEGKLLRGKHSQAGCLGGHISVQYNGRTCTCGNKGCLEAYGATWGLPHTVTACPGFENSILSKVPVIDFEAVFAAAKQQDKVAAEVIQHCIQIWSAGIVNLIHAYDPEVIVLGGGVLNSGNEIIPAITQQVHAHAWCPWGKADIRPTTLLSDAGILGVVYCLEHEV